MTKIRQYLVNGGAKEIKGWFIQFVITFITLIFLLGVFKGSYDVSRSNTEDRIKKLEDKQGKFEDCMREVLERVSRIEANQERILEILQRKYK